MGSAPKANGMNLVEKIQPSFVLQPPEEQTDNWDDDFEEGISFTKLQGPLNLAQPYYACNSISALEKTGTDDDKNDIDENARTIRPTRSPGPHTIPLALPPDMKPIDEDYSDLGAEEEELEHKVADFKVLHYVRFCSPTLLITTR